MQTLRLVPILFAVLAAGSIHLHFAVGQTILRAESPLRLAQAPSDLLRELTSGTTSSSDEPDSGDNGETPTGRPPDPAPEDGALAARQEAAQQRAATLEEERTQARARLEALSTAGLSTPGPYTFSRLEQARDELAAERANLAVAEATVQTAKQRVEQARAALDELERKRRQAKEAQETNDDASQAQALTARLAALESQSRNAASELKVEQQELANEILAFEIEQVRVDALALRASLIEKQTVLTGGDLLRKLDQLDRREDALRQQIEPAQARYAQSQRDWKEATAALKSSPEEDGRLAAQVAAHRTAMRLEQQRLASLDERIDLIDGMRTAWQRRFEILTGKATADDTSAWAADIDGQLALLDREAQASRLRVEELRRDSGTLAGKLAATPADDLAQWLRRQQVELEQLIAVHSEDLALLEESRRLHEKLRTELLGSEGPTGAWMTESWEAVKRVWNYELTSIDDRPLTVRKIVIGIVLFLVGILLARWLSRLFARRLLARLKFHASAVVALQAVTFYVLLTIFTLFALHVANVPLTVFTILGGAIALGIGFGSQNIMNNFISGLIILAERPVRVGDMIEIDGMIATVERIGARSTRIRTGANLEIIVPNSTFLENNVINWTLSDDRIRTTVSVGVAYGSPTAKVAQLLRRVADEHQLILSEPEPFVLFSNFGDNALQFDLYLWVRSRTLVHRLRIESDLRYQIDALFREAGITISFPQRDVHLDTLSPLAVRVLPADDSPNSSTDGSP